MGPQRRTLRRELNSVWRTCGGPERVRVVDLANGRCDVDVTEARDAEEQKTRNRSLAIVPLIFYPDGAG
jgi:hypothetical protein